MSTHVYIDTRLGQIAICQQLIQEAMSSLQATQSHISCGEVMVHTSNIDIGADGAILNRIGTQDTVDGGNTSDLEKKLLQGSTLSATGLPDWKPEISTPVVRVAEGDDSVPNVKIVSEMTCGALDGARIAVLEVEGPGGEKSYQIGLDEALFAPDGAWKSAKAKAAYENFAKKAMTLRAPGQAAQKHVPVSQALSGAGMSATAKKKVPDQGTHMVVTNQTENTKVLKAGE